MQTQFLFFVLFCLVAVWAQFERISDPGFLSLHANQCANDAPWWFRSDYLWNTTSDFVDAQCQVSLELPTAYVPGVTKGNETDINKYLIPPLPSVLGGSDIFTSSAAVVDFNTPCRAALWAPFTVANNSATLSLEFDIWTTSVLTTQNFIPNSLVPNATLLQYLKDPNGLLQTDTDVFPPVEDVTNMIRVDIIKPDNSGSFYDKAFSLFPEDIVASFPISGFGSDGAIPADGTNKAWVTVTGETVLDHGEYALRFAGAHSVIGEAWGISNVHLIESGGTVPINNTVIPLPYDMLVDNAEQTVGGTLTVSKLVLVGRKNIF